MSMSEEGKVRLLVISIVAMLAVMMVVAGSQQREHELDVEEGYDEMDIEYVEPGQAIPPTEDDKKMRNVTAVTEINEEDGILEFSVETKMISCGGDPTHNTVSLGLLVEGYFDDNLSPDSIRFTAKLLNDNDESLITFSFLKGYIEAEGATMGPTEEIKSGAR